MAEITRADLSIEIHRVDTSYGETIFIPLPRQAWQPVVGSCCCDWCKRHPDCPPMYDTMVIAAKKPKGRPDITSLCHYPEIANPLGKKE